jgi:hypothetical protein
MVALTDFFTLYYVLIASSFFFLAEQMLLLIIMYKDDSGWKLRFSKIPDYPNLKPIQATLKIAFIIFLVSVVLFPILGFVFSSFVISYAQTLQYGIFALFSLFTGAFFFIWHYIVGKEWNAGQVALIVLQFVFLAILLYVNYFI